MNTRKVAVMAIETNDAGTEVGMAVKDVATGDVDLLIFDTGTEPPAKVGDIVDLQSRPA